MPCSRTLNASECVARGCALQGAMLSPQFKVRDFEVVDSFPFPVSFNWAARVASRRTWSSSSATTRCPRRR